MLTIIRYSWLTFFMLFSAYSYAFFGLSSPEVKLQLPDTIDEGNLVPVYIFANNFSDDPVVGVSLELPANPSGFQRVFSINYASQHNKVFISTRFRAASQGMTSVLVKVTTASGKILTTEMQRPVKRPVSFNDPVGLAFTYQAGLKYPTNEVGQPALMKKRIRGTSDYVRVSSELYHPMMPEIGGEKSYYVDKAVITVGDMPYAEIQSSPVMSNNMFFAFDLDAKTAEGGLVKFQWHDTRGHTFNAVEGTLP